MAAMANTDARIACGKPVTPAFLLGALLWPAVAAKGRDIASTGTHEGSPINAAGQQVLTITLQRAILNSHAGNLGASAQTRKVFIKTSKVNFVATTLQSGI